MKLLGVLVLTCGFLAAPVMVAGNATATPAWCDGAGCVPYVAHNVTDGSPCVFRTRYDLGLDPASGNTLICTSVQKWARFKPLIGVRTETAPCDASNGAAQSPDGIPMDCVDQGWRPDYTEMFYTSPA